MSAQKIFWKEPSTDNVTHVEISRSTSKYGTYTELQTILATNDGQPKTNDNEWVTFYTDFSGSRTHWYKIRFYDSVNDVFSDFSDSLTVEELLRLCTVDEVADIVDIVGRWTKDEVFRMITEVDDLIYIEAGSPIQASWSKIDKHNKELPDTFYVGEENVYRIDRVFVGKESLQELFLEDEYLANNSKGMVRIIPVEERDESASEIEVSSGDIIEIHYVPGIYNKLSKYRTAKRLLERMEVTSGDVPSKDYVTITRALRDVEQLIIDRFGVQLSSDVRSYDGLYGVNRKQVRQDYDRNKYIGKHGWTTNNS